MEIPAALVDTSIIVDLLRAYAPAQSWYLAQQNLGLCRAVWLETLEGAANKRDQQTAIELLRAFILVPQPDDDMSWAVERLSRLKLSHNIDAFDCLIAAAAHRLRLTLYTRNLKHFEPLLGSAAVRPY